ncbi:MAG: hypothetical protein Q4E35_05665 [Eubacteriales bacterium]|nr:hypothetical protein [Eubacteriales bacterium]
MDVGNRNSKKYVRITDAVFALLLAVLTAILIWRAPYGLDRCDECFYLTVPYRFLQGDLPIAQEWHVSQLSGLLLTPILWVYQRLGGPTEGIVLNFRYIYIGFQCAAALAIYLLLRKKSPLGALLAVLLFLPFSPYYIMALSYNSMGIGLLLIAGLVLAFKDSSPLCQCTAGLLFAMAVLCCPYLLILYFGWGVYAVLRTVIGKNRAWLYGFLRFTAGAAAAALIVLAVILSRVTIHDIGKALPWIMDEPEHNYLTAAELTVKYLFHVLFSRKIALAASVAAAAVLAAGTLDKKIGEHKWLYVLAGAGITAVYLTVVYLRYRYINFFMLPMCILGAVCYFADSSRDRAVFRYVYVTGWVYSYLMVLSSNNFYEALTASLTVSAAASAYFAGKTAHQLFAERTGKNTAAAASAVCCTLLAFSCLFACKLKDTHGSYIEFAIFPRELLHYTVDRGPAKGIVTYDNEWARYTERYDTAETLRQAEGENVLYLTHDCWMYLADGKRNAAFSAWLAVTHESLYERLTAYYALRPEKQPDAVYVEKDILMEPEKILALWNTDEFTREENDTAVIFIRQKNIA